MVLESLVARSAGVAVPRFALALASFLVARAAGAPTPGAWIAFALGVVGGVFVVGTDPRRRFLMREVEEEPAPAGARVVHPVLVALRALFPSSVGVTVLAVVAAFFEPTLAALLAGIVGGLGVAGLVGGLPLLGRRLYRDRESTRVYVLS